MDLATLSQLEGEADRLAQQSDGEESRRLRQRLEDEGLDVKWLLSQVEGVIDHYTRQATETNPEMEEERVKLRGYVLPLAQTKKQVSAFLLVPFIGACVHVPPPPPNQMVYVNLPQPIDDPGVFAKVWLEGTIYSQFSSHSFFRVDGEQQVDVSYGMDMASLTIDQPSAASAKDPSLESILSFLSGGPTHSSGD